MTDDSADEIIAFLDRGRPSRAGRADRHPCRHRPPRRRSGLEDEARGRASASSTSRPSTAREQALRDELRLNRAHRTRALPRVVPVTREADGSLALDGTGTPVEWLLEMRRFPGDALYSRSPSAASSTRRRIDELAETIARVPRQAERRREQGRLRRHARGGRGQCASIWRSWPAACSPPGRSPSVDAAEPSPALARHARRFSNRRRRSGKVRHCHGDLHLAQHRPARRPAGAVRLHRVRREFRLHRRALRSGLPAHGPASSAGWTPQAWMLLQGYVERSDEALGLALLPLFIGGSCRDPGQGRRLCRGRTAGRG